MEKAHTESGLFWGTFLARLCGALAGRRGKNGIKRKALAIFVKHFTNIARDGEMRHRLKDGALLSDFFR